MYALRWSAGRSLFRLMRHTERPACSLCLTTSPKNPISTNRLKTITPAMLFHTTTFSRNDSTNENDSEVKQIMKELGDDFELKDLSSDLEMKDLLKEILNDFKAEQTTEEQSSATLTEDQTDTETETETERAHKSVDVDKELLRYDYEEFEEFDVEEEEEEEEIYEETHPIPLTRGVLGVFDIGELVEVLKYENTRDICVIETPSDIKFADYMVIVTGRSARHLRAAARYVRKLYKLKRSSGDQASCHIEGEDMSDWLAMDLGNIILHLFTPEVRGVYDLETLWTVGREFDPLSQAEDYSETFSWAEEFAAEMQNLGEEREQQRPEIGRSPSPSPRTRREPLHWNRR